MKTMAFLILGLACVSLAAHAQRTVVAPEPPTVESHSYIILDYHSHKLIAEKNSDEKIDPASLTKIMTAYIVYEAIEDGSIAPDDQVRVSEKAWKTEGSRTFIEADSLVSVSDLILGMVVQSGNDASVALAEHVAGSESAFAHMMNQKAGDLGMENTSFKNATGLSEEGHYSTARDMATLSRYLIRDFPEYYKTYSVREFSYNKIKQYNRNPLLSRDPSVDGIKTGYTQSAGYCLASSAERNGMRLITVVTGNSSNKTRTENSESLMNYGFRFFSTHRLYQARQVLQTMRVWGGQQDELKLGVEKDFFVTIPRGAQGNIDINRQVVEKPEAPIQAHQNLGFIEAHYQKELLQKASLISLDEIPQGNFIKRMKDRVLLFFY